MTKPREYGFDRTEAQILTDDISDAMRNLRRDWDHMLPTGGNVVAPGWATGAGAHLADHSFEGLLAPKGAPDTDTRRIDKTISLRRYVQDILNATARLVIEERPVKHGIPSGVDVPGMAAFIARHAEWLGEHDTADEAREELVDLAHRCHLVASPPRRESMSIGNCPLEQPAGDEAVLTECGGDVRVRLTGDDQDGEAYAACNRCGEVAVASWWAERMFVDGEGSPLVTIGELVAVIAYRLKIVVTHEQIRQWKSRGKIEASGADNKGRTLYRHEDVIDSIRAEVRAKAARKVGA